MRLKLDLGDFVDDARKLSLLCVKAGECATVGDVVIKICQVFKVGPKEGNSKSYAAEVALFDDGFFIHPSQCSSVLEGGGVLKVQLLQSQEVVKKKKKKSSNDDIELVDVKISNIKKEIETEYENLKPKRKNQVQEKESTQMEEADSESIKKKKKNKSHKSESESSNRYKITLEVADGDENEQLITASECSKSSKKKRKMTKKEIEDVNEDVKEWVKSKKRIKNLPQEIPEKENVTVVKNNESSSDEITVVESLKNKKSRLNREVDTQIVKRKKNRIPDKVFDSTKNDNLNLNDLKKGKQKEKYSRDQELIEANETLYQTCRGDIQMVDVSQKKTEREQKSDESDTTDSDDNQFEVNVNINENGIKKRKRKRRRKRKPLLNSLENADLIAQYPATSVKHLLPNTMISSDNSRKANEEALYNFSYAKPRNKKPMAKGFIPQNKHVIFDNDETELDNLIQKGDSKEDHYVDNSLNTSLWDLSNVNIINSSYYDRSVPKASTLIHPTPVIKVEENSCNEISSTSMQKFILPKTVHKVKSQEENQKIFGDLITMSKSEEPLICTYAGGKSKEKPYNCTSTVSSATEQHQRRSPPKGAPTHSPQNNDAANIFHNLLATQNFSQAFICPRNPSISKLIMNNTTIQPVISSTDVSNFNKSVINEQPKSINSLSNDDKTFHASNIAATDSIENGDDINIEPVNEIDDMIKFTKGTVEANLAEAKAAMNRRKRARPKAVSSIGSLLNRIRSGGLKPKEENEDSIDVSSMEIQDNIEKESINTIDPNESKICEFSKDLKIIPSNSQADNENLKIDELDNLRSFNNEIGVIPENIPENIMQMEYNGPENSDIKSVNAKQKLLPHMNKEPELVQKDEEVNDVEADFEVREIKDTDCMIVNTLADKLATGSSPHGSKLRQSPSVSRNSIQTVITVRDEENTVITVKDEDNATTSFIKGKKSYKELGEAYFDQFPVMKGLPKVKEFVAVKLLSLDEKCIPVYSNYQQAQILKVQGTNITLRYIDKLEKLPSADGQAQVVDLTLEGDSNTETIDWRDVSQPRLIYP